MSSHDNSGHQYAKAVARNQPSEALVDRGKGQPFVLPLCGDRLVLVDGAEADECRWVGQVRLIRPVGGEELLAQPRPIDRRRRGVGQRCLPGIRLGCRKDEPVGFAIGEQTADLVEFVFEFVSVNSDQGSSSARDVRGVLDGTLLLCSKRTFR